MFPSPVLESCSYCLVQCAWYFPIGCTKPKGEEWNQLHVTIWTSLITSKWSNGLSSTLLPFHQNHGSRLLSGRQARIYSCTKWMYHIIVSPWLLEMEADACTFGVMSRYQEEAHSTLQGHWMEIYFFPAVDLGRGKASKFHGDRRSNSTSILPAM